MINGFSIFLSLVLTRTFSRNITDFPDFWHVLDFFKKSKTRDLSNENIRSVEILVTPITVYKQLRGRFSVR